MTPKTQSLLRFSLTTVVVVIAALIAIAMWRHYMYSPWTREGRLRAEVVRVAADVSGPVTGVSVQDNQQVKRGDVLFTIDEEPPVPASRPLRPVPRSRAPTRPATSCSTSVVSALPAA